MRGRGLTLIFTSIVLVLLGVVVGVTMNYLFGIWWAGVFVFALSMYCLLWGVYFELQELRE